MSSTLPPSRYWLPLLLVVVAHALLLGLLARGTGPKVASESVLPVALLLASPPASASAPASSSAPATPVVPVPARIEPATASSPARPLAVPPPPVPAAAATLVAPSPLPPGSATAAEAAAPAAASAPADSPALPALLPPRLPPGAAHPPYPESARWNREEGRVTLRLKVRADGKVVDVQMLESSGHPLLDRAARDTAWRWRLLPAQREGRAVDGVLVKTLEFRLEN